LAVVGSALGLTALLPSERIILYLVQALVVLSVVGSVLAFRVRKRTWLLAATLVSAVVVLVVMNSPIRLAWAYPGFAGLVGCALLVQSRGSRTKPPIVTTSTISCPQCGARTTAQMPTNACQYFFECPHCSAQLRPKPGDCCVFCSYGDIQCPPKQAGDDSCSSGI